MAQLVLMKIGARWCGPCQALARSRTLEKFAEEHDDVRLEVHDDSVNGSAAFEKFADKWHVKELPTLIWLHKGEEVLRSGDVSARGISAQYIKVRKKTDTL